LSIEFERLRERAKPWMDPIPGPSPAGVSAKLEPAYQAVANEMSKLDMPAGGAIDWKMVAKSSGELLRSRTKDLLIASYLAHALHMTQGLDGLTAGVTLLAEMVDRLWDCLHPEVKRLRGRANAIEWFLEKTSLALPAGELASTELAKVEALEAAAQRLGQVVRERFGGAAPAAGPLLERIERMRLTIAAPPPPAKADAPPPEDEPATAKSSAAGAGTLVGAETSMAAGTPIATSLPAAPTGALGAVADVPEFLRDVGNALIGAAGALRQANSADATSYRILRIGLWLHLSVPPLASGGKTQIPPPPEPLRERLALMAQNQKWTSLLEECESSAQQHRFALDLHRLSWQALAGLGSSHEPARQVLAAEMRSLFSRMPQLPALSFGDGSPFADPQTRSWIAEEVLKQDAASSARKSLGVDAESMFADAKKLLGASQAGEALALLQEGVVSARGGRERFLARLELARLAAGSGLMAIAKATYEELGEEAAAHDLDAWEPDTVAECLKGLITCARALTKDPRGAAADLTAHYRRLCRLDPAAAHEVWP
jgi:type VI secretion system protein VasJ